MIYLLIYLLIGIAVAIVLPFFSPIKNKKKFDDKLVFYAISAPFLWPLAFFMSLIEVSNNLGVKRKNK